MKTTRNKSFQLLTPLSILLLLLSGIFLTRCYYDSYEELNPKISNTCDATDFSYATGVKPIMQDNCIGCHSGSSPSGGINLSGYDNVKKYIDPVIASIKHTGTVSPMPLNSPKLSDCEISIIEAWKNNGFPQ